MGRGKASRTSSTPSEPRLRECSGSLSDLLWYLTPCNGARSQSVKCQVYVHTSMPPHINTQIHIKVLPFIRNQQCLIRVVDGSGKVRSFLQLIHQQSTYCYQTIMSAMVWEWELWCHGMSEHDVLNLESAQLYSGRERRLGERRFNIPKYVKFL